MATFRESFLGVFFHSILALALSYYLSFYYSFPSKASKLPWNLASFLGSRGPELNRQMTFERRERAPKDECYENIKGN